MNYELIKWRTKRRLRRVEFEMKVAGGDAHKHADRDAVDKKPGHSLPLPPSGHLPL